ncbi:AraC family transcriptional regulator [Cohnella nanjingensis]|uniref:Helix-turn-helix domain-containing protein n=1 Tax=Cohnella nanjingensis TaxID=1387779 RepID=A0A7X0VDV5_9BACL|nr:AraC family transcriptional regulator [Cohnella nanjingensis]MBB6669623.1 helix-turn-helix domain-containing protein [Cohnella nanjingensis]
MTLSIAESRSRLLMQLSPNVRRAFYHRMEGEMRLGKRIIFDYELLYLERGQLEIRIEDAFHAMKPGDIVLFKPAKEHEFLGSVGECWMPHIHFDAVHGEDFDEVPINFKTWAECSEAERRMVRPDILGDQLRLPDLIRIDNHGEVLDNLHRLIRSYDRPDEDAALLRKMLVLRILYAILKGLEERGDPLLRRHRQALDRAAAYIADHYAADIRLSDLAKQATLSLYHFSRLFKLRYGVSPHRFQMRYRMDRAKELLLYSRLSMSAIAEKIGYANVYAFSKAFKQMENVPPSQYVETRSGMPNL